MPRHLARDHHIAILAAKADRAAAFGIDEADDLLVDRTGQHHLHNFHGGPVGDSQAIRKRRFNAELAQHRADLRAAAMDDDGIDPGLFEQNHVAREIPRNLVVPHGMAAIFDDDDRIVIAQHMRQSLHQDRGLLLRPCLRLVPAGSSSGSFISSRLRVNRCGFYPLVVTSSTRARK